MKTVSAPANKNHVFKPVSPESPIQMGDKFVLTHSVTVGNTIISSGAVGVVTIVNPKEPELEFEGGIRTRCSVDTMRRIQG